MSVLSAQSIRSLAIHYKMIHPFFERTVSPEGLTFGLGPSTYDFRLRQPLKLYPKACAICSTIETLNLPFHVTGLVLSKSTLARMFLRVWTTHVDPGFHGGLTLEVENCGEKILEFGVGYPIAQMRFDWLDQPTDRPYDGKYQDQSVDPVGPIYEQVSR